jgi:hypothetical protein
MRHLLCQRIGAQLELHDLRPVLLAAFEVEHGSGRVGRPQRSALPVSTGIVDAPSATLKHVRILNWVGCALSGCGHDAMIAVAAVEILGRNARPCLTRTDPDGMNAAFV